MIDRAAIEDWESAIVGKVENLESDFVGPDRAFRFTGTNGGDGFVGEDNIFKFQEF